MSTFSGLRMLFLDAVIALGTKLVQWSLDQTNESDPQATTEPQPESPGVTLVQELQAVWYREQAMTTVLLSMPRQTPYCTQIERISYGLLSTPVGSPVTPVPSSLQERELQRLYGDWH